MKWPAIRPKAFTLIEVMMVVAVMGLILAVGIPSLYHMMRKEGMRKALNDVIEVCGNARARAILSGTTVEVMFYPLEKRFQISGGGNAPAGGEEGPAGTPASPSGPLSSGQLDEDIMIEMLDVNLWEYNQSESVRVRFFPNGRSDEMTLILRSGKGEWRKITLDVATGMADWEDVR